MQIRENDYFTFQEIMSQPQTWKAVLAHTNALADLSKGLWDGQTGQEVLFTGCGSPYYLAQSMATQFQGLTGISARAYPASEILLNPENTLRKDSNLLIALSRSGETSETLRAIEAFQARQQRPVIAITCYEGTSLAKMPVAKFVAPEATETSLAQTRSFTSMMLSAQRLVFNLAGQQPSEAFFTLPESATGLMDEAQRWGKQLGTDASIERFFFLGNGPFYGLACEGMLKMKEMSLSYSEAYHFLEFRHGPMSMVNKDTLVIGLVSAKNAAYETKVLEDMRALGARVLALTPVELEARQADYQIRLPSTLGDFERGALYLPPMQMLGFYRAVSKGLNPDKPENLNMYVTLS